MGLSKSRLLAVTVVSLAASVALSGAAPTEIPPGPSVRPGQIVNVGGGWQDGLYLGPPEVGATLKDFAWKNLMISFRVKNKMIEEFRLMGIINCDDVENGALFNRRFLSSHASIQTYLRIGADGVAQGRVPLTDSMRWMEAEIKIKITGSTGTAFVNMRSIPEPGSSEPVIEQCMLTQQINLKHTPASAIPVPFREFQTP